MRKVLCVNGPSASTITTVHGHAAFVEVPELDSSSNPTERVLKYELVQWAVPKDSKDIAAGGFAYLVGVSRLHKMPTATAVLEMIASTKFKPIRKLRAEEMAK